MVLLTHQETLHTRFSRSGAALDALEQPDVSDIAAALQKAASFEAGRQAATAASHSSPKRVGDTEVVATTTTTTTATSDADPGLDDAPFIVSGPLLPIRQARRGINVNRNYRIFGTPPLSAADMQQQQQQHPDAIDAMFAPPTPVSASASASSASCSSRATGPGGSRLGSGSSRASSKSSASAAGSVSDTLSTAEDVLAGRGRQIRVYDRHQIRGISELAMEPIVLSAHTRSHSSNARTPHGHGAESDGRSGSVRVSSLLPSARSSPMISSRRGLSKSVSPRGSLAPVVGAGLAAHQYYVQRVPNGPLSEQERLSNELAARSASQICIASPMARLHEQKQQQLRGLASDSGATDVRVAVPANNGEAAGYFADSETDGSYFANVLAAADRPERGDADARAAARNSWNALSDDNAPTPTDRQRRRQAVVTEKYHVRPISASPGARSPEPRTDSPLPASIFDKSFSYDATDGVYEASSSSEDGEPPALAAGARALAHGQSTDQVHIRRPATGSTPPGLDHRATSFDLGRIGRGHASQGRQTPGACLAPRTLAGDGMATKVEAGYDGDSEGALREGLVVQRRNTVAGDKVGAAVALGQQAARAKAARSTGDYSDERRALRGSRRRPSANPLLAIGTQIAPGHANYVLMYNMLTGIRVSVSRSEAKDSRAVRPDDYTAQHKYSFDVVGDEMTPSARYDFKFKDYAPWVFRCIREAFHLSTEDYLVSLTDKYILSEVGSSGKSGSFFYYSQDYRFIIKTVHHTEHKFMRQILPQYYEFVRDHPNTLLSRIYGLHRIKLPHGRKVHFIVMSNILPPNKDIHAQFDLKGSLLGRELSAEQAAKPRACMKDKNWASMHQRLHLGPHKRRAFVEQLIEDVTLLIRLNIMDYSLLVGVHDLAKGNAAKLRDTTLAMFDPQTTDIQQLNRLTRAHTIRKKVVHTDPVALDALPHGTAPPLPESMFPELRHSIFYREDGGILSADPNGDPAQLIYYLGVIDILTPYNAVKRAEHIVKAIVHDGSQISAINPRKYGLRFLRFMIRSLAACEDVLPLLDEFERTTFQEICREHRLF